MSPQEFHTKVINIIAETPETKTFEFDVQAKDLKFKAGQFLMITVDIPGKGPVTRAYSISASPLDENVSLSIEKVENGLMTGYLHEKMKQGNECTLKGPYGVFTLLEGSKRAVFLAAGCGIVPFRSMWRYIEQMHVLIEVVILYSSKTEETIIFKKELDHLEGNFRVIHTLTRNKDPDWKGYTRRIDKDMIKDAVGDISDTYFYLCGPPPMCLGAVAALKELGVDDAHIKMEKFA